MIPVPIDPRALGAHGLSRRDVSHARVGTAFQMADGTLWRVTAEGGFDPVSSFGYRSIASDATAARRTS